ncbi:MAG: diguanylate cyclase [Pseudomonadota bacterium]
MRLILLALCVLCSSLAWADASARTPIRFGVFAYLGAEQTRAQYAPLIEYLNQTLTQERVELEVLDMHALEQAISEQRVDLVTTNPTHFLVVRKRFPLTGVIATLVASADGRPVYQLGGAIIARTDRKDLNGLGDVRGQRIAAPSPRHMGGYRAQAYELHLSGVHLPEDASQILETDTHQAVVHAVLTGHADVGFVRDGVLEKMQAWGELKPDQIKIINAQYHPNYPFVVSTRLYPEWPVFALPHVSIDAVRHIAAALLALEPDHPLARAAGIHGYTIPADYLVVEDLARTLRLPPFEQAPEFTLVDIWQRWKPFLIALFLAVGVIVILLAALYRAAWRERRQSTRTQRLLETLGEGVYGTDLAGRCTFVNPAALAMLGLAERELLGRDQHRMFHYQYGDGRPYPDTDCPIHHTLRDGVSRRTEEWYTDKHGRRFQVEQVVSALREGERIVGAVVAFQDIGARQAALRESTRLMQRNILLLTSAGDGIFGTDLQGRCTFVNPAALAIIGYPEDEVIGQDQHLLFHHRHPDGAPYPHVDCPIHKTLEDGVVREVEDYFITKTGRAVPVHLKVTPMIELGQRVGVEVVFQDISERKAMEARLIELASTDALTGLANRRHFLELLAQELLRVKRFEHAVTLLMIDIDHFKQVNDQHGHAAGDQVLRGFADAVRSTLRQTDVAGRLGGEEFAVMLPHTNLEAGVAFAERLRQRLTEQQLLAERPDFRITVSVGATRLEPADDHPDASLARADQGLYRAKASGRDRIEVSP